MLIFHSFLTTSSNRFYNSWIKSWHFSEFLYRILYTLQESEHFSTQEFIKYYLSQFISMPCLRFPWPVYVRQIPTEKNTTKLCLLDFKNTPEIIIITQT